MQDDPVVIASYARTPMGGFQGALSGLKATELGAAAVKAAVERAGVSVDAIREFAGRLPILGVCLGHQAIGAAFGGTIVRAQQLMHGKVSEITTTREGVFAGLPEKFNVNRYHSLAIERESCPDELAVTAWTYDREIMGVRHTGFAHDVRIEGVQFHPESILTEHGHAMLKNFLE